MISKTSLAQHIRHKVTIENVIDELPESTRRHVRTLEFRNPFTHEPRPGQFVMVWLPGVDEIPLAISRIGDLLAITVYAVGDCSKKIAALEKGASLGVRGPMGRGFTPPKEGERVLMVSGGTGAASLLPLAESVRRKNPVVFVLGARTRTELIFRKRLESICDLRICTDDGSEGFKGFASEYADKILHTERFNRAYACGPEAMMKQVMVSAKNTVTPAEGSLERYIKCAMGICDACAIGHLHVCTDGPVFDRDTLLSIPEFGVSRLSQSGLREKIP